MPSQQSNYLHHIMTTLWVNWLVAAGALTLELLFPRIIHVLGISKMWLPLPVLLLAYLMACFERSRRDQIGPGTGGILKVAGLTLFWSACIMLIIYVLNSKMLLDGWIDWSKTNRDIPFITCLIEFPVLTLVCLFVMSRGYVQDKAQEYRARSGFMPGNGAVATLFSMETRFQVKTLLYVSLVLNAVEWWYYFVYYFNTDMNTPDVFFFNWMPISLFIISLFFMATRYRSLAAMIGPIAISSRENGTAIRFIIVAGNRILLAPDSFGRWDTPATVNLGPLEAKSEKAVAGAFEKITDRSDFKLRYLYETSIPGAVEIRHFAAFFPAEMHFDQWPDAVWMSLDEIDRVIKSATMAAEFNDEIYRLFTITVAYKTYDGEGRRIYPIKNYRPTFKISDIEKTAVNYEDIKWLDIARNNQDRPFYRVRRLWRRFTGFKIG